MRKILYLESSTCSCKNGKHARGIIDDKVITCDEIINTITVPAKYISPKTIPTKSNLTNFYILHVFLSITNHNIYRLLINTLYW